MFTHGHLLTGRLVFRSLSAPVCMPNIFGWAAFCKIRTPNCSLSEYECVWMLNRKSIEKKCYIRSSQFTIYPLMCVPALITEKHKASDNSGILWRMLKGARYAQGPLEDVRPQPPSWSLSLNLWSETFTLVACWRPFLFSCAHSAPPQCTWFQQMRINCLHHNSVKTYFTIVFRSLWFFFNWQLLVWTNLFHVCVHFSSAILINPSNESMVCVV